MHLFGLQDDEFLLICKPCWKGDEIMGDGMGNRIKAARRRVSLSQRDLASEVGVSAMAISKYETDKAIPGSKVLLGLSRALDVKTEFFFRPSHGELRLPSYRCKTALPKRAEDAILGEVQEWWERYKEVEMLLDVDCSFSLPEEFITSLQISDSVNEHWEDVAVVLRKFWKLGSGPIENLVQVLEDKGIKVGSVDGHPDFDAITFWSSDGDEVPVVAVKRDRPGDRQRFSLAHELGHILQKALNLQETESAAHRFAGAFLVPADVARFELGESRKKLDWYELHLLKHKYGLSMQAWIYRAKDLNIISHSWASRAFSSFRKRGWHEQEPGDQLPSEEPMRMKRLILRALVEEVISSVKAEELLGCSLDEFFNQESETHGDFTSNMRV